MTVSDNQINSKLKESRIIYRKKQSSTALGTNHFALNSTGKLKMYIDPNETARLQHEAELLRVAAGDEKARPKDEKPGDPLVLQTKVIVAGPEAPAGP